MDNSVVGVASVRAHYGSDDLALISLHKRRVVCMTKLRVGSDKSHVVGSVKRSIARWKSGAAALVPGI